MKNKITLVLAASLALFVPSSLSAHGHGGGGGHGGGHHGGGGGHHGGHHGGGWGGSHGGHHHGGGGWGGSHGGHHHDGGGWGHHHGGYRGGFFNRGLSNALWWLNPGYRYGYGSYGYGSPYYSNYGSPYYYANPYPYGYFNDSDDDDDDDDMPRVGYYRGVRGPVYPSSGTSFYPVGSPVSTAMPEDGCDSLGFNGCQFFGNACKWDGLNSMCTVR